MNTDDLLRSALNSRAAELEPTVRALPEVSRRTPAAAVVGAVLLAGGAGVAIAGNSHHSGSALTVATTSPAGTPNPDELSQTRRQLDTESVAEHDGYFFHDKTVYGNVIDTGESSTLDGIVGTVVYYLTSNHQGSPSPNVEYGIAENSTKRVLPNGGYGSDASEMKPGLHFAFRAQGDDVVAILNGPGMVEANVGSVEVLPFDHAHLSLVLAHGDVTSFHLLGGNETVRVSG